MTRFPHWFLGLLMARAAARTTPVRPLTPEPPLAFALTLDEAHRAVQRQWPTSPPWMTAWDDFDRKRAVRFIEPRKSPTGEGKAA